MINDMNNESLLNNYLDRLVDAVVDKIRVYYVLLYN